MNERIYVFKRFERFWHRAQALLVIGMLVTGFEVHGTYRLLGFKQAVQWHTLGAWSLVALWIFALFWHLTTGEWRHYIPTFDRLLVMASYYGSGIFKGEPHPYRPTSSSSKHNPLQRLTYLLLAAVVGPMIWGSGALYLFYGSWTAWGLTGFSLQGVATVHTAGAFLMLAFLITHVYMITTGPSLLSQLKAMVTGWEEMHEA